MNDTSPQLILLVSIGVVLTQPGGGNQCSFSPSPWVADSTRQNVDAEAMAGAPSHLSQAKAAKPLSNLP